MAYIRKLFNENFLYYASYVIKDRAIPDLKDGLKPVQRRILHSLFEMDDGKYHKVANVIGHCMKYHPHGDQSIGSALVVLANKELFIDRQGNFGNPTTGDEASAARYIECRASAFAKEIFHNPKITEFADSYDGRNREPVHFPAKLPVVILMGAEGIAVGMSTKILPHNPVEVIKAEIACLQGKAFTLKPDFPTGGAADLSGYSDGNGKVRVRATLDTSDPKRIVVTEIPFSSTTESLIASVEAASRSGQLKIASISDFTTDKVEIEIRLQRGVYTQEVVDALYAFTECEQSISCNCLVISGEKPVVTTVSEIVRQHAGALLDILRRELEIERNELKDELHARTLERIFIEERVYKRIESQKTQEGVVSAVRTGLEPFAREIAREVTAEDIERLLKIPIRRISLYDINKAKEEMKRLSDRLAEVERHLRELVAYAIDFLKGVLKKLEPAWPRRTRIESFSKVDIKEAARRDIALRYDEESGYLGQSVSAGEKLFEVTAFDRILVVRRNGMYSVVPVPDRLFVDRGLLWAALAERESVSSTLLTVVYKAAESGYPYIKRCRIETWIIGKDYSLVPEGAQVLLFSTEKEFEFTLTYGKKPRTKKNDETFRTKNYGEKGIKAAGVRLSTREVLKAESCAARTGPVGPAEPELALGKAGVEPELNPAPRVQAKTAQKTPAASPAKKAAAKKPASSKAASGKQKAKNENPLESRPEPELQLKRESPVKPESAVKPEGEGLLAALARKKAQMDLGLGEPDSGEGAK